jgi:microcystin-dependent protein
MAIVNIQLVGPLPTCYPSAPQVFAQDIVDALSATVDLDGVNFGNTTPTADQQDRPWVRTNVDGSLDALYTFFAGGWYRKEPYLIGQVIMWNSNTLPNPRWTWCDGTASTLDMRCRAPIATSQPNNTGTGFSIRTLNDGGGDETITLTEAQLAQHNHAVYGPNNGASGTTNWGLLVPDGALTAARGNPNAYIDENTGGNAYIDQAGNDQPHNNMMPYRAIGFIQFIGPIYVAAGVA